MEISTEFRRLFIAISFDFKYFENIVNYFERKINRLTKDYINDKNGLKVEKFPHLTLIFIGNYDISKLDLLELVIEKSLENFNKLNNINSFEVLFTHSVHIYGLNALAIEIEENKYLQQLHDLILQNFMELEIIIKKEKEFSPHVTLGRINKNLIKLTQKQSINYDYKLEQQLLNIILNFPDINLKKEIFSVDLYESKNSTYKIIKTFKIKPEF